MTAPTPNQIAMNEKGSPRRNKLLNRPECAEMVWKLYNEHQFSIHDLTVAFQCNRSRIDTIIDRNLYELYKQHENENKQLI